LTILNVSIDIQFPFMQSSTACLVKVLQRVPPEGG